MAKEKIEVEYSEDNIRTLDWREHMRIRPGMYIGKTGDGSSMDDGIYILLKEVIDNTIDEYVMGYGSRVDISVTKEKVSVRDYGRGIPLGKVIDCVSQMNTGGKYDSKAFKKSVGLNGVGTKAVNALSTYFKVYAVREGEMKCADQPGDELDIWLAWDVLAEMEQDWSVFVHLSDPVLELPIAQRDMYFGQGLRATRLLEPGNTSSNIIT